MVPKNERIHQVLLAARATVFYGARLRFLEDAEPSEVLAAMPRLEVRDVLARPLAFVNPSAPKREQREVYYPAGRQPKIAVMMPGFRQPAGVRVTEGGWSWLLPPFRPTALAAPVGKLRQMAQAIEREEISPPRLQHAVIAFTGVRHGLLPEEDRDLFWRAFRTPVYEQLLGFGGELLAWECEAHEGLHIAGENVVLETSRYSELVWTSLDCLAFPVLRLATGFSAAVETTKCACGLEGPRLAGLEQTERNLAVLTAKAG